MTAIQPLRHLIIFLPGIMGSELRKDGKPVWALSGVPVWQYIAALRLALGGSLNALALHDDDWQKDDLGDGIVASNVLNDLHGVPAIVQSAGYSEILKAIPRAFIGVVQGDIAHPQAHQNFFPFPYDWRRDNRATARKLQQFIERQLPRWRESSGASDAQVILIGHSMGGLVARYYMEALGGWTHTIGLITIGTPHRGALNAVDALGNGVKKLGIDMTAVARSLTSLYQLLPIYECIQVDGDFTRPADTDRLPNIDRARARAAREEFHMAIRAAAFANRQQSGYQLRTIPWVGTRQDTPQSAFLAGAGVALSYGPPTGLDAALADGDGTVPRVSAIPSDFSDVEAATLPRFAAEQHGWLTNNAMTLTPLLATITQMTVPGAQALLAGPVPARAALSLRVEPLIARDEPLEATVTLRDTSAPAGVELTLQPVEPARRRTSQEAIVVPGVPATLRFEGLPPGLYHVQLRARGRIKGAPTPVNSMVEIADATADEMG
ncbi:MAG: lecithin--cholesterol acyltransferase [Chloroflexi bacterium]|nr:lecithin--cholesterol acyltransferase [Chloroflexota bacterium]